MSATSVLTTAQLITHMPRIKKNNLNMSVTISHLYMDFRYLV